MKKKRFHWITNFPKNYPWHKKLGANLLYLSTGFVIHPRKNLLTTKDIIKAKLSLRKGDICLWGNVGSANSVLFGSPLTHATLYVGRKHFIEATLKGVDYESFHHFVTTYDHYVILRMHQRKRQIIRGVIRYAKQQIGKPYDFDFSPGDNSLFCTELVNSAYQTAGYKTGLANITRFRTLGEKIEKIFVTARKALHPARFLHGNFRVIRISHNLEIKGKKIVVAEKK